MKTVSKVSIILDDEGKAIGKVQLGRFYPFTLSRGLSLAEIEFIYDSIDGKPVKEKEVTKKRKTGYTRRSKKTMQLIRYIKDNKLTQKSVAAEASLSEGSLSQTLAGILQNKTTIDRFSLAAVRVSKRKES